jgi:peptide/nickel transport system substrate-binding protein
MDDERPPSGSEGAAHPLDREPGATDTSILTFLIADVRGYTLFTQTRGDEAAGKLAARFAEIVREHVERRDGRVLELRGDEALCVFASARQAIRASVELQDRLLEETLSDPELPLPVGIGLDAGEAVPVEGGYRGGALNLAARLCGQAKAGEIVASREVAHLARHVDGVRYQEGGSLSLKNLAEPVAVVRVISEAGDPAVGFAPYAPPPPPGPPKRGRRRTLVAAGVVIALIAVAIPVVRLTTQDDQTDVQTNSVVTMGVDGAIQGSTPLDARPGAIAAGAGAVWVARPDDGRLSRIDIGSGAVVDTIAVGGDPSAIAVGEGSVWVANAAGPSVSRISPDTNDIVDTIETCSGPNAIAAGAGAVWVTCAFDDMALKIDPESGATTPIVLPGTPSGITVTDDAVWVSITTSAIVVRVDPETLDVISQIEVGNGPEAIVATSGAIWVANRLDGTVDRLDPETGSRRATIEVGRDPSGLAASDDTVWVTTAFEGRVVGISTGTTHIDHEVDLGKMTGSVAVADSRIWVTAGATASDHRGGTLRISFPLLESLDPGFDYGPEWQIISLTHDGLVGYRRVGGIGGSTLVPDLALSLPVPTDEGTTYRFQLRPGIHYSNGEIVQPKDVRFALERVLGSTSEGRQYYLSILGAEHCSVGVCDLSDGIVVDASANTITFHLNQPDTEFLFKLAMPFAFPVPPDTPDDDQGLDPIPATGPYMVTGTSEEGVELGRNPEFRTWNSPARPDGFPDRIVIQAQGDGEAAIEHVLDGSLDWTRSEPSPQVLDQLLRERPGQVHLTPTTAIWHLILNNAVSPFDDVRVRQALNLALDRDRIAAIFGGTGRSTCQIFTPNFPSYDPYCPFTLDPGPTWNGPDMVGARALISEAGAMGLRVEIAAWTGLPAPVDEVVDYLVQLLNDLGLRATARTFSGSVEDRNEFFTLIGQGKTQIALLGWSTDWAAPGGVLPPQFSCDGGGNVFFFCEPRIDDAMERASALQGDDPAAAASAWADIEHRILDLAPLVPLVVRLESGLVSERTNNYQNNPFWGTLLDQLWVV